MNTTTQRVYNKNMPTIRKWMKLTNCKTFAKFIERLEMEVKNGNRKEFYKTLPQVFNGKVKPLSHCKIDKKKIRIQKIGAGNL